MTPFTLSFSDVVSATLRPDPETVVATVHLAGTTAGRTAGRVLTGPELPEFDFGLLALGLAAVSFGLIGVLMAGAAFFGEQAERAKRTWLPTTIQGLVLVGISAFIIGILAPNFED